MEDKKKNVCSDKVFGKGKRENVLELSQGLPRSLAGKYSTG